MLPLKIKEAITCPECGSFDFEVKREVTYLYSYKLETPSSKLTSSNNVALPFLFDNREKIDDKEYVVCKNCKNIYPCNLDELNDKIHFTIVRKAIRADQKEDPEYFG